MRRRAQPWLGTLVEITILDEIDSARIDAACAAAFDAVARVHRLMSFHTADSDVSRINRAKIGEAVAIDPATALVLRTACALTEKSDGIFDVGCASRLVAWQLLPDLHASQAGQQFSSAALDWLDVSTLCKRAALLIDLGGIAKGYAVDQAMAALREVGIAHACVNAGGDLRACGSTAFPTVIRDPRQPTRVGAEIALRDMALATSASYFSLRDHASGQVSALLDGRNGRALTARISASVLASNCMIADALTKVVLASGDPAHPLLREFDATAFII